MMLKKCLLTFVLCMVAVSAAFAKTDYRKLTIDSVVLGKTMRLYVYVPEGYTAARQYPVLYWLHGLNSSEFVALNGSALGDLVDEGVADGAMEPMIIVAPQMDNGWGTNTGKKRIEHTFGELSVTEGMYDDYFIKEVIPYVEANFSVRTDRAGRYIGGLSMGGYSAVALALRHAGMFGKVGGHSPSLWIGQDGRSWYKALSAETRADLSKMASFLYPGEKVRNTRDPFRLAKAAKLDGMQFWLDAGEQDHAIHPSAIDFSRQLKKRNASVKFFSAPGGHDSQYWTEERMVQYLQFYCGLPDSNRHQAAHKKDASKIRSPGVVFSEDFSGDLSKWIGQQGDGSVAIHSEIVDDPLRANGRAIQSKKKVFGGDFFTKQAFARGRYTLSFDYLGTCKFNCGATVGIGSDFPGRTRWLAATDMQLVTALTQLKDTGIWEPVSVEFQSRFEFHLLFQQFVGSAGAAGDVMFRNIVLTELE